jgi:hypothetical protein
MEEIYAGTGCVSRKRQASVDQRWLGHYGRPTDRPIWKHRCVYIDLGAEKLIAAEKDGSYIAVEVKSFLQSSVLSDFHTALGQFLNY